jgi:hypothetical protein
MADDQSSEPKPDQPSEADERDPTSASEDLSEGLDLMLRAARKALSRVNSSKLEAAGRRAFEKLENLDAKKVGELGRKAAKNLDPRRIEEIAEEAGRELINVIERVADRVETAVGGATRDKPSSPPAQASEDAPAEPRPRVRVDDED